MLQSITPVNASNQARFAGKLLLVNAKTDQVRTLLEHSAGNVVTVGDGFDVPVSPTQKVKLQPLLTGKDAQVDAGKRENTFGPALSTIKASLAGLTGEDVTGKLPQTLSNLWLSLGMVNQLQASPVVYATHQDVTAAPALLTQDVPDQAQAAEGALMAAGHQGFVNGFFPSELGIAAPLAPKPGKVQVALTGLMPNLDDLFGTAGVTSTTFTSTEATQPTPFKPVASDPAKHTPVLCTPIPPPSPTGGQLQVGVASPAETAHLLASLGKQVTRPDEGTVRVFVEGRDGSVREIGGRPHSSTVHGSHAPMSLDARAERVVDQLLATLPPEEIHAFLMSRLPFEITNPQTREQWRMIDLISKAEKASGRVQTESAKLKPGEVYGRQVCVTRLPSNRDELQLLAAHVVRLFAQFGHQRVSAIDVAGDAFCFDMRPDGRGWQLGPPTSIEPNDK